jgi:hypothetical protein
MLLYMTSPRECPPLRSLDPNDFLKQFFTYSPKVTTLYGLMVPEGEPQIVRYDDGTGEELLVPLGTTACTTIFIPPLFNQSSY